MKRPIAAVREARKPDFDADFSPSHPTNVEAARARGLTYDSVRRVYVDRDGYPVRDQFGQKF
jgi:hypothetical protein